MFNSQLFDDLSKKLYEILPQSAQQFEQDIKDQFKSVLQAAFAHLDLVTREEFDVQVKVLARTRAQLEELKAQIEKQS